jgi:transcriptional regulator with XRE-family HTH domain
VTERHGGSEVGRAVAANLRGLRAHRGWSQDQLAQRSGVSKGVLVALETDRGNPSLTTLCRLADAFGVSLTQLVDVARPSVLRSTSVAEASGLWHGPAGGYGRLVLSTDQPNPVELWWWRLEPGEARHSEAHAAGTREAAMVIDGQLVFESGDEHATVPAGSAGTWPGDRPHAYRNDTDRPAEFVLVVTVPG